jgi:transcriptional regulator with XRE-family HTH domain
MSLTGQRIAKRRAELNMTQEELATLVGTNQKQISRYENGHNDPTGEVLSKFAKALDTTVDWLVGMIDDPTPHIVDLTPDEQEVISAWRRGEKYKAIELIVTAH